MEEMKCVKEEIAFIKKSRAKRVRKSKRHLTAELDMAKIKTKCKVSLGPEQFRLMDAALAKEIEDEESASLSDYS